VIRRLDRIAQSEATVLLTGETGTGKEVMARRIHQGSSRAGKAFVAVNCGAIPEALIESELFGHVRGAFTGAVAARRGRVALAHEGTLFLDEIGELPLSLQVKLLRLLQQKTYEPVGSPESVTANFRLIAATNRNLAEEVEAGRFRRDLYYRLLVCPMELPPLRERGEDVEVLFLHFWRERGEGRPVEPSAMRALQAYAWPGNVRELENLVERVSVCAEGDAITVEDLPQEVRAIPVSSLPRLRTAEPLDTERASEPARNVVVPFPQVARGPRVVPPPADASPISAAYVGPVGASDDFRPSAQGASPFPVPAVDDRARQPTSPAVADRTSPFSAPRSGEVEIARVVEEAFAAVTSPNATVDLPALLRRVEEAFVDAALELSEGNRKAAADRLGLQRTTLVEKLRRRERSAQAPTASA
jgi:sigma-54 specific flagellar transcriptional regulator A